MSNGKRARTHPSEARRTSSNGLTTLKRRLRAGRRSALAKACSAAPGLRVHDAMAGWGIDGLVLAGLGCAVHMSERVAAVHEVLAARIADALAQVPNMGEITCACEDARARWRERRLFDVVYLDPMFPPHPTSAAPGKHMRLLAEHAAPTPNAELGELLAAARRVASSRVVVKRAARAPALPGGEPDWVVRGRSVRFDVYAPLAAKPSMACRSSTAMTLRPARMTSAMRSSNDNLPSQSTQTTPRLTRPCSNPSNKRASANSGAPMP